MKIWKINLKEFLPNLTQEALETAPACHFWNGGIEINEKCETNIRGLYAEGEVTGEYMERIKYQEMQ